ncbi:IS66 family transposase [Cellulosilyticum ruminicola]|uniref:IS66 family transposase n=1 Tax=Cellulosilyticum ruminicola TaxID=425254 RepID=UPI0012ED73F1
MKGFTYCINQDQYLRVFLENGNVQVDNNAAEQSIRSFCIDKANWHLIDTINGTKASAIYSCYSNYSEANVVGSSGLPVTPFRLIIELFKA